MPENPLQSYNGSVAVPAPKPRADGGGSSDVLGDYILYVAGQADDIAPWGTAPKTRDQQLRKFVTTEPILASAIFSTASRYSGFEWTLNGPDRMCNMYERILHSSQHGQGWLAFMMLVVQDYLSQDNGAIIEVVRTEDSPTAPVIQLNHLDSNRCTRTGNDEYPAIYYDREGDPHRLAWYQMLSLCEMPSPIERQHGRQICAVSRVLEASRTMRDINRYKRERATGQDTKQIHVVSGVSTNKIDQAIAEARAESQAQGFVRYTRAVVVGSLSPDARAQVATIDLAKLVDGYDEEKAQRDYIVIVSMALGNDYQDFAPLPSGAMGSGAQSETLALKTRGKGPNYFMRSVEFLFNYHGILPKGLEFAFGEPDSAQDLDNAKLRAMRAEERAMRIKSGEISPEVARLLARDAGDLPEEYLQQLESFVPMEMQMAQLQAETAANVAETRASAKNDPSGSAQVGRSRVKKQEGNLPATSTRTA